MSIGIFKLRCSVKPSTVEGYYQPLNMISIMLDYAAGGRVDDLMPFRRTSLILHIINTMLIIFFLYLLFGSPWAAAMAGLLFGVHPMRVEAIAWIGERKTLLAAFFVLLSLILYVLYTRKSDKKFLWASLIMYVPALMSKPISTPLPVLMLLLDYWPVKRLSRKTVFEKIPFFIIGFISAIITFLSQKNTSMIALPHEYNLMSIPLILCHNIIFYLYKTIRPVNMSSYYPFPRPFTLSHPMVMAGLIGTFILIPALLISLKRTRALLTGWLFFFTAILPAMGIIGFTDAIAADKYAYLPSVGLLLPLAWYMSRFWEGMPRVAGRTGAHIGLIIIVLALSVSETAATRHYLIYWQDSETLCRHMLSLAPDASSLHGRLGNVLAERGKFDEAVYHFKEAIRLNPGDAKAQNNLGTVLGQQGKTDEAISCFNKAIQINPNYAEAYINIGVTLAYQGKPDDTIRMFHKALQIQPDNTDALTYLGKVLAGQGKYDEAARVYLEALRINPKLAGAQKGLEVVLLKQQNSGGIK